VGPYQVISMRASRPALRKAHYLEREFNSPARNHG
jgi:hypothetical protein